MTQIAKSILLALSEGQPVEKLNSDGTWTQAHYKEVCELLAFGETSSVRVTLSRMFTDNLKCAKPVLVMPETRALHPLKDETKVLVIWRDGQLIYGFSNATQAEAFYDNLYLACGGD